MTKEKWNLLNELYNNLDRVINEFNISYDYENEEYKSDFLDADDELIASIENAHKDLEFFLGEMRC